MDIGCLAKFFNKYEDEVIFAKENGFKFMQLWYDSNGLALNKDENPLEVIKQKEFETIIHAVLDINEFREHIPKLLDILKYLGHREVIIHPICHSEEITSTTIYKLSDEAGYALELLSKEHITLYLENNSKLDPIFSTVEEIQIMFNNNPKLEFLLDLAHIDDYEVLKQMVKVKMPKILHIADRHFDVIHEHLPIGQGDIDFEYVFSNILTGFQGKVILEIIQSEEDIINSKKVIENFNDIRR